MFAAASLTPTILVVEDNYIFADVLCDIVRSCGFEVAGPVATVQSGLALLNEKRIDAALVDIDLQGTKSYPICSELRRRHRPFAFVAGHCPSVPLAFSDAPFLMKPVADDQIRTALRAFAPHAVARNKRALAVPSGNRLLASLGPEDKQLLAPHLVRVALAKGAVLEQPGTIARHVWFPESGMLAVCASSSDRSADVALIGREGLASLTAVLEMGRPAHRTVVRFAGDAQRISVRALMPLLAQSRRLHIQLLHYGHAFMAQLGLNALTAGQARLPARLACWLLMAADRTGCERLQVTHELLSQALGVRRASITTALNSLEEKQALRCQRSHVCIRDRNVLVFEADGFYGTGEDLYADSMLQV